MISLRDRGPAPASPPNQGHGGPWRSAPGADLPDPSRARETDVPTTPIELVLTLAGAARLARVTPETIRYWLRKGELPAEIEIPAPGRTWHLPSGALIRHLRAVNSYLGDRIAEELEVIAFHWNQQAQRHR